MARFTSVVGVQAPVDRVWQRITDWPVHGRWIPFTTVTVTSARPDQVGSTFVGRTAIGPLGFDDPMEIVQWQPPVAGAPGRCRVQKHGRVILGWAEVEVASRPDGGSTVRWTEEVEVAPVRLTRPVAGLIATAGRLGFDRALRSMARELEQEVATGG